jgi:NAD(P)-dependent dehydrogenase (short-subunit alcohol dehydrogenase family)
MSKVVFITGGSRGIGKAVVEKLASEGHMVIFTYLNHSQEAEELTNNFGSVFSYQNDQNDYETTQSIAAEVLNKYSRVDILINNAGIMKDKTFAKMDKETWDEVINTNLKSLYNFTSAFLPAMVENRWGRIVNLSSVAGVQGAFGKTNYSAAKAGVIGFTKALALELAAKKITVNAIAPGMVETDMIKAIPEKYREQIINNIPAKRFAEPQEIAELVSWLTSEKAEYVTGQVLHVNGGMYT